MWLKLRELQGQDGQPIVLEADATDPNHPGEAFAVRDAFPVRAPCRKCREIHKFNQAVGLPQDERVFKVPDCAEDSWVLKQAMMAKE
jgi:hypothetical protein